MFLNKILFNSICKKIFRRFICVIPPTLFNVHHASSPSDDQPRTSFFTIPYMKPLYTQPLGYRQVLVSGMIGQT